MPELLTFVTFPEPESIEKLEDIVGYLMSDIPQGGSAMEALSTLRIRQFFDKNPWARNHLDLRNKLSLHIVARCGAIERDAFFLRWATAVELYYGPPHQSPTYQGGTYEVPQGIAEGSIPAFDEPTTTIQQEVIVSYFIAGTTLPFLQKKTSRKRLVQFFTYNPWATSSSQLCLAIANSIDERFGSLAKEDFIIRWNEAADDFYASGYSNNEDYPSEITEFEEDPLPYLDISPEVQTESDWTKVFPLSPHRDQILSAILPDKIILFKGGAILESELNLDTPCSYKANGYAHCHNVECKITTMFWITPHGSGEVLDVLNGETMYVDLQAQVNWTKKHSGATVSLCKETQSGWHCECGTLSSNGLIKKLSNIGHKCIKCYLQSIHKCSLCPNLISVNYNGLHHTVDGEYIYICKECSVDLKQCSSCGKHFKTKPLLNGYCMDCAPSVILDYNHKPNPIFWDYDNVDNAYMGIEVEVEMKEGLQHYSPIVASRFQQAVGQFAYLKKDSSISKEGFEIVTHPATIGYWHHANVFWDSIKKLTKTCEAWSVDNCGMHVHISRDAFDDNTHMAKFMLFINSNRLLSAFVAERYNAKQAPFMDMDLEMAKTIVGFAHKINRHCAVNVQPNIPTIEVRIFKGNLKKQRMLKNIEFVHSVFTFTKTKKPLEVEPYIEHVDANKTEYPNLCAYISKYKRKL